MVRMKGAKQLSSDVCQAIAQLSKNGVKLCVIAKSLEAHPSTVSKALKRYKERKTSVIRKKRGRIFKLSPRNLRLLRLYLKQNCFTSLQTIANLFRSFTDIQISISSLRRYIHRTNTRSLKAVEKPFFKSPTYKCSHDLGQELLKMG